MGYRASRTHHPGGNGQSAELATDIEEFLPPMPADAVGVQIAEVVEGLGDGIARGRDHGGGIAVGAAGGFFQDLVGFRRHGIPK
jgi:hypothetical protein